MRSAIWITGAVSALVTFAGLSAIFGPRHWAYMSRNGYSHSWYHHRYHDCNGADSINRSRTAADSTAHY